MFDVSSGYMNFQPKPEYEKAVEDCTEALKIDPKYNRAVMRRATALEKLGRLEESLRGAPNLRSGVCLVY